MLTINIFILFYVLFIRIKVRKHLPKDQTNQLKQAF